MMLFWQPPFLKSLLDVYGKNPGQLLFMLLPIPNGWYKNICTNLLGYIGLFLDYEMFKSWFITCAFSNFFWNRLAVHVSQLLNWPGFKSLNLLKDFIVHKWLIHIKSLLLTYLYLLNYIKSTYMLNLIIISLCHQQNLRLNFLIKIN